jgi:hypothetical protein
MALEPSPPLQPTPDTLLRLQTEINVVKAQHTDLMTKVRQRRVVEFVSAEASTIARARRVRDQLLTAPARHAALLAARHGLTPATLNAALVAFVRDALRAIANGPTGAEP